MYRYPEHLIEIASTLPKTCGVYIFHGENGAHPLYIGKSVNIRTRVLSHLRTEREARLLKATTQITYIETIGEIGALLLESTLIKQHKPLYNKRLRKVRRLCSIAVNDESTRIVFSDNVNFSSAHYLYGLFARRSAAVDLLRDVADDQKLCLTYLDVEKRSNGSPCFRYHLGKCSGACCGMEAIAAHQERLRSALSQRHIRHWPYCGRIAIKETKVGKSSFHVINNWFYMGTASTLTAAIKLDLPIDGFDRDCYRILCKPLLSSSGITIIVLDSTPEGE